LVIAERFGTLDRTQERASLPPRWLIDLKGRRDGTVGSPKLTAVMARGVSSRKPQWITAVGSGRASFFNKYTVEIAF
jgi:hypothetical protein